MNKIKIVIQHFHGCPNGPQMIQNVKNAIMGWEDRIEFKEILVEDRETAARLAFRGSPTLLINGEDFENLPKPSHTDLSCRLYLNGLPTVEAIKEKISSLL